MREIFVKFCETQADNAVGNGYVMYQSANWWRELAALLREPAGVVLTESEVDILERTNIEQLARCGFSLTANAIASIRSRLPKPAPPVEWTDCGCIEWQKHGEWSATVYPSSGFRPLWSFTIFRAERRISVSPNEYETRNAAKAAAEAKLRELMGK